MEREWEPAALRDDFHLTCEDGQRHPHLSTHFKTLFDRVLHVGLCFRFRLALTDTSRNSRTFSDVGPIFVTRNGDRKLQGVTSYSSLSLDTRTNTTTGIRKLAYKSGEGDFPSVATQRRNLSRASLLKIPMFIHYSVRYRTPE
jgi:hypothetical protein